MPYIKLNVTSKELQAIIDIASDIEAMLGCVDNDGDSDEENFDTINTKNLKCLNRMFKRNSIDVVFGK